MDHYVVNTVSENEFDAIQIRDGFEPGLYDVAGVGLFYIDGCMTASIGIEGRNSEQLQIFSWDSENPGQGHSRRALQWLRDRFEVIIAVGAGETDDVDGPDISLNYWSYMMDQGLVDVVLLDDGTELDQGQGHKL